MDFKRTEGGVCAPKGFKANGVHCGIRENTDRLDLGLIFSEVPACGAAVYTTNLVKGAPLAVTKKHLENGMAQAIIFNSGNANTCNADGIFIADEMCKSLAKQANIDPDNVLVASTGVIGQKLDVEPIKRAIPELFCGLDINGSDRAARAVMTTDTVKKEIAVEFDIDGMTCHIGGIAKGSGMIHPNMATMLAFITTDVNISSKMLKEILSADIEDSFNMVSVDGDTSTNDMVTVLANGLAGNNEITCQGEGYDIFCKAFHEVTTYLAKCLAKDGEGADKLIICTVNTSADKKTAVTVAKSIICSNLLKCAVFGSDANWGRVLCAIGYSGADVDVTKIDVVFESKAGSVTVCRSGAGVDFSEELAKNILDEKEIQIIVELNSGNASATAYGCDLTYEYVNINGSYRS